MKSVLVHLPGGRSEGDGLPPMMTKASFRRPSCSGSSRRDGKHRRFQQPSCASSAEEVYDVPDLAEEVSPTKRRRRTIVGIWQSATSSVARLRSRLTERRPAAPPSSHRRHSE